MSLRIILLSCLCSIVLSAALAATVMDEDRLLTHLRRQSAHPLARPVKNIKDAVEIKFGMSVQTLFLDEKKETLYTRVWLNYDWKDPFLTWDSANFSGIESVRVPVQTVWHPDIEVYNTNEDTVVHETRIVLYSDGTLNWVPLARISSDCVIDLTYFPFDNQVCTIKVGSWTYDGSKVNLTSRGDKLDTSNYSPNKEWDLFAVPATRSVKLYDCCPEPYIDITFTLSLARRSTYFTYVYVAPVTILSLLAAVIFVLPPGNPQKMTLGGALLICYGLFFLDSSSIMPPVHVNPPLIDKYYMAMYIMLGFSVFLSAIATNLAKRSWTHSHPPELVKKIVLSCLGRCLCVPYTGYSDFRSDEELTEVKAEDESGSGGKGSRRSGQIREWILIAIVFDRLFLIVYLVLTILLSIIILSSYSMA